MVSWRRRASRGKAIATHTRLAWFTRVARRTMWAEGATDGTPPSAASFRTTVTEEGRGGICLCCNVHATRATHPPTLQAPRPPSLLPSSFVIHTKIPLLLTHQHVSPWPWSRTGETAPLVRQSTLAGAAALLWYIGDATRELASTAAACPALSKVYPLPCGAAVAAAATRARKQSLSMVCGVCGRGDRGEEYVSDDERRGNTARRQQNAKKLASLDCL